MVVSAVQIRKLTAGDFEAFKKMETGIENDYVARIFSKSVNREETYGLFIEGQLVSIAAYTVFAGRYAVLGRLRTDLRFRGQGLATKLLIELCRMVDSGQEIKWVGLATELSNHPVHRIAEKLGMARLAVFCSCVAENEKLEKLLSEDTGDSRDWVPIYDNQKKRELLKKVTPNENPLRIFPYECYYPLPYEDTLWGEDYLSACTFLKNGDHFVLLMPDEKGGSYLHVKYFGYDVFSQSGLWRKVITEARKTNREVWIDLPYGGGLPEEKADFFRSTAWTCYGRRSPQIG